MKACGFLHFKLYKGRRSEFWSSYRFCSAASKCRPSFFVDGGEKRKIKEECEAQNLEKAAVMINRLYGRFESPENTRNEAGVYNITLET